MMYNGHAVRTPNYARGQIVRLAMDEDCNAAVSMSCDHLVKITRRRQVPDDLERRERESRNENPANRVIQGLDFRNPYVSLANLAGVPACPPPTANSGYAPRRNLRLLAHAA
jgi:hypothetical protein